MLKDVFVIGCSIENHKQLSFLSELIHNLCSKDKDFLLVGHTLLPESIVSRSKGFLYLPDNPKYNTAELGGFPEQTYATDAGFSITSPTILLGATDYLGVANLKLILNGLDLAKRSGYEAVHWIDYDCTPNYAEIDSNLQLLEKNPMIYYGNSSHFSVLLDSVKEDFKKFTNDSLIQNLKSCEFSLSRFLEKELVYGHTYRKDGNLVWGYLGKYDQLSEKIKIHWSLFKNPEIDNICIFILNTSDERIDISFSHNEVWKTVSINSNTWLWEVIQNTTSPGIFEILIPNKEPVKLDLSKEDIYNKIISPVKTKL